MHSQEILPPSLYITEQAVLWVPAVSLRCEQSLGRGPASPGWKQTYQAEAEGEPSPGRSSRSSPMAGVSKRV